MYDVVIDSIHRQLTAIEKVLNELKSKDSVNYFPLVDTLKLDSVFTITVDSIVPDYINSERRFISILSRIPKTGGFARIFFLPTVRYFTGERSGGRFRYVKSSYNWSQYADSVYNRW